MSVRTFGRWLLATALLATPMVLVVAAPAEAAACSSVSAAAWDTCTAETDGTMIEETVSYTGPIGPVKGRVCRPLTAGPHEIMVMNHGATQTAAGDLTQNNECRDRAREGWYVIASDYRPLEEVSSPTSDGCLGEVDDVVAMVDVARTISYADDSQIGMRGLSLGGCVTLQIHQQGLPGLIAAASINGPSDWTAMRNHSRAKYNQFLCWLGPILNLGCPAWGKIANWAEHTTGGVPGPATQAAYDARSPIIEADDTAASSVPLALMQGAADPLITPAQTCAFAAAVNGQAGGAWDFTPVHYGTRAAGYPVLAAAAASCPGVGTWYTGPTPWPTFPSDHYLAVVDGFNHAGPAQDLEDATGWADAFIASKR